MLFAAFFAICIIIGIFNSPTVKLMKDPVWTEGKKAKGPAPISKR